MILSEVPGVASGNSKKYFEPFSLFQSQGTHYRWVSLKNVSQFGLVALPAISNIHINMYI